MIWLLCFVAVGTVSHALCGALGARWAWAHVLPNSCMVVMVFISLRREPIWLALAALLLGSVLAHDSLSPLGLHATALMVIGFGTYLLAGSLAGGGILFFALNCAVAATAFDGLLYLLLLWQSGRAHFASWAGASLLFSGLFTGLLGLLLLPMLRRLDQKLSPKRAEGLVWRS